MILYVWHYLQGSYFKVAVIDYATSVIWVKRFNDAGEFEIYLPASTELLELFTDQTIITRDDEETVMIFEKIKLTTDDENGDYLTISGRSIESIIERRIISKQTNFNGKAESCIRKFMEENIISPSDGNRKIDLLELGAVQGYTETIDKQATGKNLLDTIKEICVSYEYGFKIRFVNGKFIFDLYKGTDRSLHQSENTHVVFSSQFENLGNTEYSYDITSFYNSAYVGGEGEGKDRVIENASTASAVSMYRREMWVDARSTSSNTDESTLTPKQYAALLVQQGNEELRNAKETKEFSGELLDINQYVYGKDYQLGDKVSIVNEYRISGTATVTEITEVEDENGYKITPTFSEWSE